MNAFSNLKIGTKLVSSVLTLVALGIISLIIVISSQVSKTTDEDIQKILSASVNRYANYTQGIFQEMTTLIEATSLNIRSGLIAQTMSVDEVEFSIISALDASSYAEFAYLHLLNPSQEFKNQDRAFISPQNRFMMFYQDSNVTNKGGVKLINADDSLLTGVSVPEAISKKAPFVGNPRLMQLGGKTFYGVNIV